MTARLPPQTVNPNRTRTRLINKTNQNQLNLASNPGLAGATTETTAPGLCITQKYDVPDNIVQPSLEVQ